MKILVVSAAIPFPPIGGGQLRTYHLLRALAMQHEVTLVGFSFDDDGADVDDESPFSIRTRQVPWQWPPLYRQMLDADESTAAAAAEKLDHEIEEPWFVSFYESSQMENELRVLARDGFDLIIFEATDMARFLPNFPDSVPKVLDFMDVHSHMAMRAAQRAIGNRPERHSQEAVRTLQFEKRVAQQCRLCLTCSDSEAEAAQRLLDVQRVAVIPNGVDTSFFMPAATATDANCELVFTGTMNYAPNVEAVRYFALEILPRVLSARPTARFHVVGAKPTDEVMSLAGEKTIIHGRVPDIRPYLSQATVFVAPILSGGGTRLKILEAAACGKAIVTTTLGAEGLDFRAEDDILIADSPEDFTAAICRLTDDEGCRERLGRRARESSLRYDWEQIGVSLRRTIEMLV